MSAVISKRKRFEILSEGIQMSPVKMIGEVKHDRSRGLKLTGRQRHDDGRNHLVKISYCKENLSCIIHRMN